MKKINCTTLPATPEAGTVYYLLPRKEPDKFYYERTDRNIGWITKEEQEILKNAVVGIAGCGGMGGLVASTLLRLGVGEIRIADSECFDISNLNRQYGATQKTVGKSKAFETARFLRDIADDTTIVVYPSGITEETADSFTNGCNIICDEIEFWAVGSRILLHQAMRAYKSLILNSPTIGHRVYVFKFTHDSLTVESMLHIGYKSAIVLQQKIQSGNATESEIHTVMDMMLQFAAPELPEYSLDEREYSTVVEVKKRLLTETTASIIATNPPMASGFLANQILFELLKASTIKRNFVTVPRMPGYLMFDAGLFITKKKEGIL